jgi:hypothetical protein
MKTGLHAFRILRAATPLLLVLAGCGASPVIAPDEPNDSFNSATAVGFSAGRSARITGAVERQGDLDVFSLGALATGDRLLLDASTPDSSLDVALTVFDTQQRLVYENDDRGGEQGSLLDSYIDFIIRHAGNPYYVVVSHSAFAASGTVTGRYQIDLSIESGFDVPQPVGQILLLDFNGGSVDSPTLGQTTIAPFSGRAISPIYRSDTTLLKELIRATVEQNFDRFNVTVLTTDEALPANDEEYSTIFLGGFNNRAFGIAEQVDLYNTDFCDDAIVYSESFSPGVFTHVPTVELLAEAIGNIVAHEAGHLLGLNHVDDELAIMDGASPADTFLLDQEFKEAPLSSDIVPIGVQDAVMLLNEAIGPRQ